MCSSGDAVKISSMSPEIKNGYVLWYKKRIIGKNWREVRMVLHEDSTLVWYLSESSQEGGVLLKDAPEMIAAGQFASHVPGRPDFPEGPQGDIRNALAIGSRTKSAVNWFLFRTEDNLRDWIEAMSSTLPPPPQAPQEDATQAAQPYVPENSQPPPAYNNPTHTYNVQPHPSQGQYSSGQPGQPNGYRGNPQFNNPQQQGQQRFHPPGNATYGNGSPSRGYRGRRGSGGSGIGNFATGMLVGGAIGGGFGGWGYGFGWGAPAFGYYGGFGGGYGGYHGGMHTTHVTNEYNTTNVTTNNDNDVTNNTTNNEAIEPPGAVPNESGNEPGFGNDNHAHQEYPPEQQQVFDDQGYYGDEGGGEGYYEDGGGGYEDHDGDYTGDYDYGGGDMDFGGGDMDFGGMDF